MKLDAKSAQALSNLRASADFRSLLEFLKEDHAFEMERCRTLDGVALHRAQGAATKLHELFTLAAEAPSALEKLRNQPKG